MGSIDKKSLLIGVVVGYLVVPAVLGAVQRKRASK